MPRQRKPQKPLSRFYRCLNQPFQKHEIELLESRITTDKQITSNCKQGGEGLDVLSTPASITIFPCSVLHQSPQQVVQQITEVSSAQTFALHPVIALVRSCWTFKPQTKTAPEFANSCDKTTSSDECQIGCFGCRDRIQFCQMNFVISPWINMMALLFCVQVGGAYSVTLRVFLLRFCLHRCGWM